MPHEEVGADHGEVERVPRRHGGGIHRRSPGDGEQRRERRDRGGGEPPRDQVDARQVREEQEEHRRPEPEEVPSREPEDPRVQEREPAGVQLGEIAVRELTDEDALRALGERAVVQRDPAVVQLRRDEDRARNETDGRNRPRRRARQLPGTSPHPRPRWAVRRDGRLPDARHSALLALHDARYTRGGLARAVGAPTGDARLILDCNMGSLDTSACTPASMTALSRHVPLPRAHVPWTIR